MVWELDIPPRETIRDLPDFDNDTNVISELLMRSPNMDIVDWLVRQHSSSVFTTAVTEAEILYGLRILAEERRRQELEAAILPILREDIGGRVLPFDRGASDVYATIATNRRKPADRSAYPTTRSQPLPSHVWRHLQPAT